MLRRSVLTVAALALAGPASAMQSAAPPANSPATATASSPQPTFSPHWERQPTGEDLGRLYPQDALKQGLAGHTTMKCKVLKDGGLTDCTVLQEDPPDHGFGQAALAAVPYFKLASTTADGKSVEGGSVVIPIGWRVGAAPAPQLPDLFPDAARTKSVGGRTEIKCRIQADRTLTDCEIISECPKGFGFGRAALRSAQYFKMRESLNGQRTAGGQVILPMTWRMEGAEPPAECLRPAAARKP